MPAFTAPFAALDADTREYLREVRRRQGDRTPGLYFGHANLWPLGAFLLGPCVIVLGVLFAVGSSKDAWAVALLLTAAGLLGGWLVVYAFRRWLGGNSAGFAGYFTYFDPTHVYRAAGEEVTVYPLSPNPEVAVRHNLSDGNYGNSTVTFRAGSPASVTVSGQEEAEAVAFYYEAVGWLKAHDDSKWRDLPAAERGGVAKHMAAADGLPRDLKEIDLEVAAVPANPRADGRAPGNGGRYLVLVGVTAALYFALWATMGPTADALAFEAAQESPAALRTYLLDERNTRHREQAKQKLAGFYAPAEAKAQAAQDAELKRGLLALLAELKQAPTPVTSLDVFDTDRVPEEAVWNRRVRTELADALAQHLGRELVAFVEPPAGVKPHVELEYKLHTNKSDTIRVSWRLRFRPTPDATPIEGAEYVLPDTYARVMASKIPDGLKRDVFEKLFNTVPPVIVAQPTGDGDW